MNLQSFHIGFLVSAPECPDLTAKGNIRVHHTNLIV